MHGAIEFLDDELGAPAAEEEGLAQTDWARRADRILRDRRWRFVAAGLAAATVIATFGSVPVRLPQHVTGLPAGSQSGRHFAPAIGELLTQYEERVADRSPRTFHCMFSVTRPGSTAPVAVLVDSDQPCPDLSYSRAVRFGPSTP